MWVWLLWFHQGELKSASVKSCSVSSMELLISRAYVVAAAEPILPFQLEDAARPVGGEA